MIFIGTAGWSVPRAVATQFPDTGTHLERYARVLNCAEINSSFYRPHAFKVYERWAASTPVDFRFAVKTPRAVTHEGRLRNVRQPLEKFLTEVAGLKKKLGILLVQLPPSLRFEPLVAKNFFTTLRELHTGAVACEPRHASWFEANADTLLMSFRIARVAADPAKVPHAAIPGGWLATANNEIPSAIYYRLHGSPRMYWSRYSSLQIATWAKEIRELKKGQDAWFIFDNTAAGAAIENALELRFSLRSRPGA